MMTSAQVVETSVSVITDSPSQDYTHPDDHTLPTYDTFFTFDGIFFDSNTSFSFLNAKKGDIAPLNGKLKFVKSWRQ